MKPKYEERERRGVARTLYVDAKLPVSGVRVKVRVYGKLLCAAKAEEAWEVRAADVPARGFEEAGEEVVGVVRVVKRRPVERPTTEESGE